MNNIWIGRGLAAIATAMMVVAVLVWSLGASRSVAQDQAEVAKLDQPVKDFKLKDVISGKEIALSDFKGKVVLVVFHSYRCLVTWAYEKRMAQFAADYKKKGVVTLGIDSDIQNNEEAARKNAEQKNLGFPLLKDKDSVLAYYFDVNRTPTFFVIDPKGVLRYRGAFDDLQTIQSYSKDASQATKYYLKDAMEAVLAGKEAPAKETEHYG